MSLPIYNKITQPASRQPGIFTPNAIWELIRLENRKQAAESTTASTEAAASGMYWQTGDDTYIIGDVTVYGASGTETVYFDSNLEVDIANLTINSNYSFPTTLPGSDVYLISWNGAGPAPYTGSMSTASSLLSGLFWVANGVTNLTTDTDINITSTKAAIFKGAGGNIQLEDGVGIKFKETVTVTYFGTLKAPASYVGDTTFYMPPGVTGDGVSGTLATQAWVEDKNYLVGAINYWRAGTDTTIVGNIAVNETVATDDVTFAIDTSFQKITVNIVGAGYDFPTADPGNDTYIMKWGGAGFKAGTFVTPTSLLSGIYWVAGGATTLGASDTAVNLSPGQYLSFAAGTSTEPYIKIENTVDGYGIPLRFYADATALSKYVNLRAPATLASTYTLTLPIGLTGDQAGSLATQDWSTGKFPLKAGTGATGTWGISITGNATTATSATSATTASSATIASTITVTAHATNNIEYGILWNSGASVYNTTGKLTFNPSLGRITAQYMIISKANHAYYEAQAVGNFEVGVYLNRTVSTAASWYIYINEGSTNLTFHSLSADRMYFTGAGAAVFTSTVTATNFLQSSDARLKEEVRSICGCTNLVDKFRPVSFKMGGRKQYGFIAQEVREFAPELVTENENGYLSMDYISVIAHLVKEVQKLKKL